MRFGYATANFMEFGSARLLAELAYEAEQTGWDGFFIADHLLWDASHVEEPNADPWISLAAMAMRTERIRLGPMITPIPRRHIAKLAREIITLDHLSNGRLTTGFGAGYPFSADYTAFGDFGDPKTRAAKFDEGLEVLAGLWGGRPVSHLGTHYQVECATFHQGVQQPRVPMWVSATWPSKKALRRAARWDGVFPMKASTVEGGEITPTEYGELLAFIEAERGTLVGFDAVQVGRTEDQHDTATVEAFAEVGVTWWFDWVFPFDNSLEAVRTRIRQGPPRF